MHQKFRLCDILSERYLTQEILIFLGYCLNRYKITHYKGLIMYKILLFIALTFSSNTVFAATFEVEMLNRLGKESMVYSQNIVNVKAGDTVKWISASKGHNVQFLTVPEGVDPFRSKLSVDTEYTFTKTYLDSEFDAGDTIYFKVRADNDTNSQYSNWTAVASYVIQDVAAGPTNITISNTE